MKAVLAICLLGGASAARLRGPDDDHFVRELHDNAKHKEGTKPTTTLEKDFVSMDRNGDHILDTEELMFRQYATGCEPMEAQVRSNDYMRCGDSNKDGEISLQEFNASAQPAWTECIKESSLRRAHGFVKFIDADANLDSNLTLPELRVGMIKLWGLPGDEIAEPLMKCADKNKDGNLNEDEFHNSIAAYNPASRTWQMWNGTSDKTLLTCMEPAFKKFDAALVFHATDTNKDDKISRSECYDTMRAVNGPTLTQTEADAIFDAADKDKNKFLNLEEFMGAGEAHKGETEAAFFLGGRATAAKWPTDTYNDGYGMSIQCHDRDGNTWRVFSEGMGRVRVTPTDTAGGVKVTQR